jgi:hypothetical protein
MQHEADARWSRLPAQKLLFALPQGDRQLSSHKAGGLAGVVDGRCFDAGFNWG